MNIVMKYFEAIDLSVMSIRNTFDQKGFQCGTAPFQGMYRAVFQRRIRFSVFFLFFDDFDKVELESQLCTLYQLSMIVV